MQNPFDWVKQVLAGGKTGLALFSPPIVQEQNAIVRIAVAGGTVAALFVAGLLGVAALAALMFALAAIYFLSTQVLGLKLNVDPQAFYQTVQRQAASYGAN
ncbi:MAG: hypothetical protein EXR72_00745 [Myxococcales bacterium]|nr:hypothetical protein [Myxococcales bacterium]